MSALRNHPIHRDVTGSFQELARKSEGIDFGQLSILSVSPGCVRGGHYHIRKKEYFCCTRGRGLLELVDIETDHKKTYILDAIKDRVFIEVLPGFSHTVINNDRYVDLEVLIIISEEYDEEDPDTFKY